MKAACHTKLTSPSKSQILAICNPSDVRFSNKATEWGCKHEKTAREVYFHPQFSHLGATPDGIISCQCCGGVLEIKCPYCSRDDLLTDATSVRKDFCLQLTEDGDLWLSKTHTYYYQVQTQVYVCNKDFPDFVVWTQNDVHIERLLPDDEFLERNIQESIWSI